MAPVVLAQLMDLGVAVVAAGDAVVCAGGLDLLVLEPSVLQTGLLEARLQEPPAAAAAVVVGAVGLHIDEIFFSHHRLDDVPQIFGDGVAVGLADDLTRILNGELDLQVLVPVGVDLQLPFTDPLRVVLIDVLDDEVVLDVEFFQSCQD
jgi:hypothetical protein